MAFGNLFGGGKKPPKPKKVNAGQEMYNYLFGETGHDAFGITDRRLQNQLIEAERFLRPQYTELALGDLGNFLFGTGDTQGLMDIFGQQASAAGGIRREELQKQRDFNLGGLGDFLMGATSAYRQADPTSTNLAGLATNQAETLYNEAEGQLSPERAMMAEQAARRASVARGRELDNSSIADELLGREAVRSQLRNEARAAGGQAFNMNRSLVGDMGMGLFGQAPASVNMAGGLLGAGQMGSTSLAPQLYDPNVGVNLGLAHTNNMNDWRNQVYQIENSGGLGQILGSLGGAALGGYFGGSPGALVGSSIGGSIFG